MANIPGATNVLPGVFTDVVTQSRGVSIPGGSRVVALLGEGSTDEVIVSQAAGGGLDGLNSSYTSATGADGRHFQLVNYPLISNRVTVYKNGIALTGVEDTINSSTFSNRYGYRIDISTGRIELQRAHIQDQGGADYVPLTTNTGDGYLTSLTLIDVNAPSETWTIRCVSVQRSAFNVPIAGTAKFIAFGSISGAKIDSNGNPILWQANGQIVSNGVLSFAIWERKVGGVAVSPFVEGDGITVIVTSGSLVRGDSLTANYIVEDFINDAVTIQGMDEALARYGTPSTDNNLSLGCQLAFANQAPSLITLQTKPPIPRRTSYSLTDSMQATSTDDDDFIFPLPIGVVPAPNSQIHFFVTNNDNVETQILPNKLAYYLLDTPGYPTTNEFITASAPAPTGYSYYYTVKESFEVLNTAFDGYIARTPGYVNRGVFSSVSSTFDATYVNKALKIIDATNSANIGLFHITAVSNNRLTVIADGTLMDASTNTYYSPTYLSDFTTESSISFEVIDIATGLALDGYSGTDGVVTTVGASTGQATLTSATVDFNTIPLIATRYRLQINGSSENNDGLYDISNPIAYGITITKAIVDESNMRFEVLDPTETSNYIVVNKDVVPDTYALRVTIVDNRDATFYDAGWIDALEVLETVECDIVVPLPKQTISVIFQNTLSHCKLMSNIRNKKERVLFCGAISGLLPANVTGTTDAAVEDIGVLEGIQGENVTDILAGNIEDLANYSVSDAFGNTFRCVYFYPDQITVQAGSENVVVDGFYIAAAAAGYECADVRVENPLTNKTLVGFTISRTKQFSTQTLESLASAGVTTLQPVSGGGRVVWGITTSQSGYVEEQEISVVFIRDKVAKTLRAGFQGFIGQPESVDTAATITTRAVLILNSLVSQGIITTYKDLVVKRDDVDPTQWDISVRVQPTYPVNFIYIRVELGRI